MNAIEAGIVHPQAKERIEQLEAQRDRARRDLDRIDDAEIRPEDFARFLQHGANLDDKAVLDAFVYQALVSDEDVLVTLNYDTAKREPARFEIKRVLTNCDWCPRQDSNLRLSAPEADALSPELRGHNR